MTINVRILNRIGQQPERTAPAVDHNIDVICMPEHRYILGEDIKLDDTGNRWRLVPASAWKNSVTATIDVGMLIGPLNCIEKMHPGMLIAAFNGNSRTTINSCYSPTNVNEETDLIAFYPLFAASRDTMFSSLMEKWIPK